MNKTNLRPIAFVIASTNHGSMIVNRNDYRITPNGGYGVGYQLLNTSSFDQDEVDLVLQLLAARREHYGDEIVAIDCGANIGVHTIEWAKFMHGWGQVLAFEAQEKIFYALAGNIAINNCFNAKAFLTAIGGETRSIKVPTPNYHTPSSYGSLEMIQSNHNEFIGQEVDYSDEKTTALQMVSIDGLGLKRVDFIKLDIEGMEIDALNGAINTIQSNKPQMLIEKIKVNEQELINLVTGLGYKIFPMGINILAIHASDPVLAKINSAS